MDATANEPCIPHMLMPNHIQGRARPRYQKIRAKHFYYDCLTNTSHERTQEAELKLHSKCAGPSLGCSVSGGRR